jgi:hypothetical protein
MAASSGKPASSNGAWRCRTTSATACSGSLRKVLPIRSIKDNEGHGFANEENRFEFYAAMEAFFAKHLKP